MLLSVCQFVNKILFRIIFHLALTLNSSVILLDFLPLTCTHFVLNSVRIKGKKRDRQTDIRQLMMNGLTFPFNLSVMLILPET